MNRLFKISLPILLILGLVLTTACAQRAPSPPPSPRPLLPEVEVPSSLAPDKGEFRPGAVEPGTMVTDRKVVKTGSLTLEVSDIVEAMDKVGEVAKDLGGYVVASHKYETKDKISGVVSIRVPADRFEEAFGRLRRLAIKVPSESTQSRDVTEEYTDLKAQLRNLEATESQYLALLEKAQTVEEILKVQKELSKVRGQIEQVKGRILYLERTSDMALIEVRLEKARALTQPGWSASNTLQSAIRGLATFGRVLADVAIWLGIFCWVWIPPLVFWFRRWRRAG